MIFLYKNEFNSIKNSQLILLIVFFLVLDFGVFAQKRQYFRNAFIDVFGQCHGSYSITEDEAVNTTYYVFEYDTLNRLYEVKKCKMDDVFGVYSDVLKGIRLTYTYEKNLKTIKSYNFGTDVEEIYSPSSVFWEVYLDSVSKNVFKILTIEQSNYDDEIYEENGKLIFNYEKNKLISLESEGINPFYFGRGAEREIKVKLNKFNQVIDEINLFNLDDSELDENEIIHVETLYNEFGDLIFKKKFNKNNEIIRNQEGICYLEYSYSDKGFVNKILNKDCFGNLVNYKQVTELNGDLLKIEVSAEIENYYDDNGNLLKVYYYDQNRNPFLVKKSIFSIEYRYDSLNNLISQFHFGPNHEIALDDYGYSGYKFTYHDIGKVLTKSYFGVEQKPIKNNFGIHKIEYEYDEYDLAIAEKYFDENNNPMEDNSGAHKYIYEFNYDEEGFAKNSLKAYNIKNEYLGIDEVFNAGKYFINRVLEEEDFLLVRESWFDENRNPIMNEKGYFKLENSYDENRNQIEEAYYDENLNLVFMSEFGYAKKTMSYKGELIHGILYFGANSKLILNKDSIAEVRLKYNANKQLVERTFYNEKRQLIDKNVGFCKEVNQYDEKGNLIAVSYFGNDEKLMDDKFGISVYKFVYNNQYLIEKSFLNYKKKPKLDSKGVFMYKYQYDDKGNLLEESYWNDKNQLCENIDSVAKLVFSYDENNHLKDLKAINLLNQPAETLLKGVRCYRIEIQFDSETEEEELKFFNKKEEEIESSVN